MDCCWACPLVLLELGAGMCLQTDPRERAGVTGCVWIWSLSSDVFDWAVIGLFLVVLAHPDVSGHLMWPGSPDPCGAEGGHAR